MKRKIGVLILCAVAAAALSVTLLGCGGGAAGSDDQQEGQAAAGEQTAGENDAKDYSEEIKALADLVPNDVTAYAEKELESVPSVARGIWSVSDDLSFATPYVMCDVSGGDQDVTYCFPIIDNEAGKIVLSFYVMLANDGTLTDQIDEGFSEQLNEMDYMNSPCIIYAAEGKHHDDTRIAADNGTTIAKLSGSADKELKAFEEKPFEEKLVAVRKCMEKMSAAYSEEVDYTKMKAY